MYTTVSMHTHIRAHDSTIRAADWSDLFFLFSIIHLTSGAHMRKEKKTSENKKNPHEQHEGSGSDSLCQLGQPITAHLSGRSLLLFTKKKKRNLISVAIFVSHIGPQMPPPF